MHRSKLFGPVLLLIGAGILSALIFVNREKIQAAYVTASCPKTTSTSKGIEFRTGLEGNYRENVSLLIGTARRVIDSDPHAQDAIGALDDNAWDLGYFLQNFYGLSTGQKFTALWQERNKAYLDYATALRNRDTGAKAAAMTEIQSYADDNVSFWKGLIPNLDTARYKRMILNLSDSIRSSIDAYATGSVANSYKEQHSAFVQTGQVAEMISDIITKQQPEKFGQ